MATEQHKARGGEILPPESMSSWDEIYSKFRAEQPEDIVPEGWSNLREIASKLGRTERTARLMLKRAVDAGQVETRDFRVTGPGGNSRVSTHYKPKDE